MSGSSNTAPPLHKTNKQTPSDIINVNNYKAPPEDVKNMKNTIWNPNAKHGIWYAYRIQGPRPQNNSKKTLKFKVIPPFRGDHYENHSFIEPDTKRSECHYVLTKKESK